MKNLSKTFIVIGFLSSTYAGIEFLYSGMKMANSILAASAPTWFGLGAIAICGAIVILLGWFGKYNKWIKRIMALLMIVGLIGCVSIPLILHGLPQLVAVYFLGFVGVILTKEKIIDDEIKGDAAVASDSESAPKEEKIKGDEADADDSESVPKEEDNGKELK